MKIKQKERERKKERNHGVPMTQRKHLAVSVWKPNLTYKRSQPR